MSETTTVLVLARGSRAVMRSLSDPDVDVPWAGGARFVNFSEGDGLQLWEGTTAPGAALWAAAFRNMDASEVLEMLAAIEALPWPNPDGVQVLVRTDQDEVFGLWMFVDGRLREMALPTVVRVPGGPFPGPGGQPIGKLVREA
jgi:hypothetical protein